MFSFVLAALLCATMVGNARADEPFLGPWSVLASPVSAPGAELEFGRSVVLDGDNLLVGEPGVNAVHLYTRQGASFGFVSSLAAPAGVTGLGAAMELDGDTLAVAAFEAIVIYERSPAMPTVWTPTTTVTDPAGGSTGGTGIVFRTFGSNGLALEGDSLVVGVTRLPADLLVELPGQTYVFERDEGGTDQWGLVQELAGAGVGYTDFFGADVELLGDTLFVGASRGSATGQPLFLREGAVHVFRRTGPAAAPWNETFAFSSGGAEAFFGEGLAAEGDTLIVGAPGVDFFDGRAYVFQRDLGGAENWGQSQEISPCGSLGGFFGQKIAVDGSRLVIASPGSPGFGVRASAHLLERLPNDQWEVTRTLRETPLPPASTLFGFSIALQAGEAVIGAPANTGMSVLPSRAYSFDLSLPVPAWPPVAIPAAALGIAAVARRRLDRMRLRTASR